MKRTPFHSKKSRLHRGIPDTMMIMVAGILFVASTSPVMAVTITYNDFADTSTLQLNGDAQQAGNRLRLVSDQPGQAGSAFLKLPFHLGDNTDFSSVFEFQVTGGQNPPMRSDGFTFLVSAASNGTTALGGAGGDLGYGNHDNPSATAISKSVAIEFDTYRNAFDPNDHHIALDVDGDVANPLVSQATTSLLDDGSIWKAIISYYGKTDYLNVMLYNGTGTFDSGFTQYIDIPLAVVPFGSRDVNFGFTGATGDGYANYDILNWELTVPEPGSLALFSLGAMVLGAMSRRKRA